MHDQSLYLRQNVQLEPLIDHWYAWPHLIPPANYARNITERHLKIMESYISSPQLHANAVKNPKMLGGPFIDYGGKRVEEIRELRDRTKTKCRDLLELSAAIAALDRVLQEEADGHSLQPFYSRVPEALRGFVELVYDLSSHPSMRLIEPLLYRSKYYNRSLQSLMLSAIHDDGRPFVLSTPRLRSEGSVSLNVPFDDESVDRLFRLKAEPQRWQVIKDMLPIADDQEDVIRSFLTPEPPPRYVPYQGKGVRWRYFGHACILIETQGISILCDPVLSYTYESGISRHTYLDLPDTIDYVLITHNHQDHILFETLLQLRHKIRTLVVPRSGGGQLQDPSLKLILENCGFKNVLEVSEMQRISGEHVEITGLPFLGEHADLDIRTKLSWLVRIHGHSLLFMADACNIDAAMYAHVHDEVGDVDVMFLGMECDGAPLSWLYGPLLTQRISRSMDESRRLSGSNCAQGLDLVDRFGCRELYVYAMGQEPWLNYIMSIKYTAESKPIVESDRLVEECRNRGIIAERLFGEKEILIADSGPERRVPTRVHSIAQT